MKVALYTGRHEIVDEEGKEITYGIYDDLPFTMDFLPMEQHAASFLLANRDKHHMDIYVTGFTPALTSLLVAFNRLMYYERPSNLTLHHFDRDSGGYLPQTWFLRE